MKVYKNGEMVDATPEEVTEIEESRAAHNDWKASIKYKLDRKREYPSLAEQLDMQYHDSINGTTTWADAIQAVKDKYPKPGSN